MILSRKTRGLPLERCCQLLGVSRSLVYKHCPQKAVECHDRLREVAGRGKNRYLGYRRLCFEIGESSDRTRRLMRRAGIRALCRGRYKPAVVAGGASFEGTNLWRNKEVEKVGTVLGSDVTYVNVGGRFCYVAVTLDLCSRKVVGWAVSDRNDNALTLSCLSRCEATREPGWVHHSDRGHNYTSHAFTEAVASTSGLSSFSRAARPYDNAIVERFFATFKFEGVQAGSCRDKGELLAKTERFVEEYNTRRRHSSIRYMTPEQYEREHQPTT